MSKKIQDKIRFLLHRHNNVFATEEALQQWTKYKKKHLLEKLNLMQSSLEKNNHEEYSIAYKHLKKGIKDQEYTLNQIWELLLYEREK